MSAAFDIAPLQAWVGRTRSDDDVVTARLADSLWATLGEDPAEKAGEMPLGLHWCLAPEITPQGRLADDGLPGRGDFLPPVPLPRRMWAGGRIEFPGGFQLGDAVEKVTTIQSVTAKEGRSGPLCFVAVDYRYLTPRGPAVIERHDIVYRGPGSAAGLAPMSAAAEWKRDISIDAVRLFRFSALTFNGHRIHFDRDYCREAEGYEGLLVHGPLQAALLLNFAAHIEGSPPRAFDYRAISPLYEGERITLNADREGAGLTLWVADNAGRETLKGTALW